MRITKLKSSSGFTIVELMIALTILSVILVIGTVVLIQIGALYSKGINAADLQNANRNIVADVSGQLQFSGKVPSGCTFNDLSHVPPLDASSTTCYFSTANIHNIADGTTERVYAYCIANTRYTYVLGRELGTDSSGAPTLNTQHVLWRDTLTTDACPAPVLDIVNNVIPTDASTLPNSGYEMVGNHMSLTRFKIDQVSGTNIYTADVWMAFGDADLVRPDLGAPIGRSICQAGRGTQFCSISSISTQLTGRIY